MSIGNNIKKLRELKNFTQSYVADFLNMSQSGYGKIERDETDISLSKLKKIATILEVDYNKILSFDDKNVFNIYNNQNSAGVVSNQQLINQNEQLISQLFSEISKLREEISAFKNK